MKLKYPVSKSHMAFLFNVEEMFEKWPNSIYMWTFTFRKYQPDHRAMMRWKELQSKLVTNRGGEYPLLVGLRVVEVHPGNNFHGLSHGLHFHCLFNQRVSVHRMRRLCNKLDFGRIHVRKVSMEEAMYVGKYLTKGQPELLKGARRWGTINWPAATRVRHIKIESQFHTNMRKVQDAIKTQQLSADIVHSIYVNSRIHGDYENWPTERYYYSGRAKEVLGPDSQGTRVQSFADPTLKPLVLLRSNKSIREESMHRQAQIWKEKARRRSIGYEACVMEDMQKKQQKARVESETKPSGKIFYGPGGSPGNPRDYYLYKYDKHGSIISGTPIADDVAT